MDACNDNCARALFGAEVSTFAGTEGGVECGQMLGFADASLHGRLLLWCGVVWYGGDKPFVSQTAGSARCMLSTMVEFTHSHRLGDGLQLASGDTERKQAALQQCWGENAVRAGTKRGFDAGQGDLPLVPRLDIRRRAEPGGEGCGG